MSVGWGWVAAIALIAAAGQVARADEKDDAFEPLRQRGTSWRFQHVRGAALDALAAVPGAAEVRCTVAAVRELADGVVRAELACSGGGPLPETRVLQLDRTGVRELIGDETTAAGPFTFPHDLRDGWRLVVRSRDGTRRTFTGVVLPGPTPRAPVHWQVESTAVAGVAAGQVAGPPVVAVTRYQPGHGPTLMCTRRSDYDCLQLIETAPAPAPPPSPPKARPTVALASSSAAVKSTLAPAKVGAALRPHVTGCYRGKLATARAKLSVVVTINAVGRPEDLRVTGGSPELTRCVTTAVTGARFPIPQSEYAEPRAVRYTAVFQLSP